MNRVRFTHVIETREYAFDHGAECFVLRVVECERTGGFTAYEIKGGGFVRLARYPKRPTFVQLKRLVRLTIWAHRREEKRKKVLTRALDPVLSGL